MQTKKRSFEHTKWGMIIVNANPKARRIIMRARPDAIYITTPPFATGRDVENALAKFGDKLKQQQTSRIRFIDTSYRAGNGDFRISIEEYSGDRFMWIHNAGTAVLMSPEGTDYAQKQDWLQKAITEAIASEARKLLPARLERLAEIHGFKYNSCSVRNTHSRWGSCNSKGAISLCIYLVLLPDRLIDYVILHELCHTVELNHSAEFWRLLDNVCRCDSKRLRKELKEYSPSI